MHTLNRIFDFNSIKQLLHSSDTYYIICTDTAGNYSYINKRYQDSFSFIAKDLVNQPYHITMHPDDMKVCEEVGGKCYANPGKLFPATIRKYDGRGGFIITQWEFTLITENDTPVGIFCLGYDITEYTLVKNKVQDINKDLEYKNEVLGSIAFEQSHMVRAPLSNILGLIKLLKKMGLGAHASSVVDMLEESSKRLDLAVKQIVQKTNEF